MCALNTLWRCVECVQIMTTFAHLVISLPSRYLLVQVWKDFVNSYPFSRCSCRSCAPVLSANPDWTVFFFGFFLGWVCGDDPPLQGLMLDSQPEGQRKPTPGLGLPGRNRRAPSHGEPNSKRQQQQVSSLYFCLRLVVFSSQPAGCGAHGVSRMEM